MSMKKAIVIALIILEIGAAKGKEQQIGTPSSDSDIFEIPNCQIFNDTNNNYSDISGCDTILNTVGNKKTYIDTNINESNSMILTDDGSVVLPFISSDAKK